MRLLLDTHALLWWLAADPALTRTARDAIASRGNDIFVSAASAWEITTKHRIGKLPGVARLVGKLDATLRAEGFAPLPVTILHGEAAGALAGEHRDPFDRMLIAQALQEVMGLVSNEQVFDAYGVARIW